MVPGDVSKGPGGIPAKKNFKLSGHLIFAQQLEHQKGQAVIMNPGSSGHRGRGVVDWS